jgi:cation diffusion facilitator family transporter
MNGSNSPFASHEHVFLGAGHEKNERKTKAVIILCSLMMVVEIIGGSVFGSLALVADGLHMSTHASAMLIAALAYWYARKHAKNRRFVFGTGKLGDLAGFTSAVILAMIALLIGYEAVSRILSPVPIRFTEAIPIAVVGLFVNIASAWLLRGDDHHHGHDHTHEADELAEHDHDGETKVIDVPDGQIILSVFEEGVPPVFRLAPRGAAPAPAAESVTVSTLRQDGSRQRFQFVDCGDYLESTSHIPEPHAFEASIAIGAAKYSVEFAEHDHGHGMDTRDHNIRAAYIHVIADAAVSVLAIVGLSLAKAFGWLWMDPLAGIVGALVIGNWSYGLMRDTGVILLDVSPGNRIEEKIKSEVERAGDQLVDLHVWRLGPGQFGAILSVVTNVDRRSPAFYHSILQEFKGLSHITVEVHPRPSAAV